MSLKKIISIPHFENVQNKQHDDTYYHMIKNSSQEFKDEIHDIYFGKIFRYKYNDIEKRYSNPMGVEATDAQVDNLFKIQKEFGIEISLTINSVETPHEILMDKDIAKEFVSFIGSFYERGLRSCTIASPHIMKSRILHRNFPEMRWKNTVNHRVADDQQVMNYIFCGYDTILLDRSLNRNLIELKRIRKAVDYYNNKYKPAKKVVTSLLVREGCLYGCPFKKEHDSLGEYISAQYFKTFSRITCDNWRFTEPFGILPRNAIDITVADKETFHEFAELNDIFKFSGRFSSFPFDPQDAKHKKVCWVFMHQKKYRFDYSKCPPEEIIYSGNLGDVIHDNVMPLHSWEFTYIDTRAVKKDYKNKRKLLKNIPNFWRTPEGRKLEKKLKTCRSKCWSCHECEKTFGTPRFDSALQIQKTQ
ncbi:MAG: hypothetical protein OEM01_00590 [Desulfobulbaceae bacterium]|nr:hypothetical protein [Desulfobulbaceae bacterium]